MFNFIASIFGYLLYWIYNIVGNYGIAIIIFTLLTKLILLPLTIKQHKSLEENKKMQPLLQELQVKYKDDQQKMAEEYQKLMKETKFNPFSGCLISLLQIPILFGLLFAVGKPLTNIVKMPPEQIKQEIISIMPENYEGDYEQYIAQNRYAEIEVIKQKGIFKLDFLGINLGDVASENKENWTLYVLPILTAVVTWMSVYTLNGNQPKEKQVVKDSEGNEVEMPNMQLMNIMMPVMSGYIAFIVPQGLALYWFTSSILQIGIQLIMKKMFMKEEK
ncbi:MAG: YidC/Oxa1 family membrane protein insertase [Clostridia bacterium]|nr:YidC/Oxa1 family membrane protein insertase [Clostridia bacterium]